MKRLFEYNFKFLDTWMHDHRKNQKDLLGYVDIKNYKMTRKWLDGELMMTVENILKFCNSTNTSPAEFFLCDGKPVSGMAPKTDAIPMAEDAGTLQMQLEYERKISEMKTEFYERIDREKKDLATKFEAHIKQLQETNRTLNKHLNMLMDKSVK